MSVAVNTKPNMFYASREYIATVTDTDTLADGFYGTVILNKSTALTITMGAAANNDLYTVKFININSGVGTISDGSTIVALAEGESCIVTCNGSDWYIQSTYGILPLGSIPVMTSAEFATKISDETGTGLVTFNTAPTLKAPVLDVVALSTTPVAGKLEYFGNKLYFTNKSLQKVIDRTSDVATSCVTAANTTTETTVFTAAVPSNSWVAGNILKMYMAGSINNANSAQDVTTQVKVGGNTMATLASVGGKLTDACWHIRGECVVQEAASTGSMAWHADMVIDGENSNVDCSVSEIDTTGALDITVTATWDNANAGNIFICCMGFMEYKN